MARDHGAASFTISDALVCSSPLLYGGESNKNTSTNKKINKFRGAFLIHSHWSFFFLWYIFHSFPNVNVGHGAISCRYCKHSCSHEGWGYQQSKIHRASLAVYEVPEWHDQNTQPQGKNGGWFSCCYSCDIFRNVQKDTEGIVGSSTSSGVRSYHVGNYHGRESATAKWFFVEEGRKFFMYYYLDKISGSNTSLKQSFQYCQ